MLEKRKILRKTKENLIKTNGITLMVLIITIIILLILAGITVATLTGDNGLIKNSINAKEETEISNEKEVVDTATLKALANNKTGILVNDELQNELDKITGDGKTEVKVIRKKVIVEFTDSKRMYRVDNSGNVYEYVYADLPIMEDGTNFNSRMNDYKNNILTVTVLDNMNVPENAYQVFDVSKEQNETVKAWLVENAENENMYDLYIGGNDGVDIENCQNLFGYFSNCVDINLENLYTEKVKNFSYMFSWDTNLKKINLENLNTSNATGMQGMFNKCNSLSDLDVSNFNTSKVTSMQSMFYGCAFTEIDLSNFDTSNVTSMNAMFRESKVEVLDLSNFDTSNVENTDMMFYSCVNLKTIYVSDKWNNNKVTNSSNMFHNCKKLIGKISYDNTKIDINYANYETGYFTYKDVE